MKLLFPCLSALLLVFLFPVGVLSQQIETDLPENWSEPLSDEEVIEPSVWSDLNEWYQEHPVSLKTATRQQLLELPGMNGLMADAILNFQITHGFQHLSHLSEIPEISSAYLPILEKWVIVDSESQKKSRNWNLTAESRHRSRLNQFSEKNIRFEKFNVYNRVKIRTQSGWTAGLIAEKDRDESKLTDYVNATIFYQNQNSSNWMNINKFSAGAYQLAFGEGLLFSRSATMGKSSSVISSPVRNSNGLSPYLSTDENRFLSGVSGSVIFPNTGIETGGFYSSARYDGERKRTTFLDHDGKLGQTEDFRFDFSGIHSTPNSISKKDKLPVEFFGGWVDVDGGRNLHFTGLAGFQRFDKKGSMQDSGLVSDAVPDRYEKFRNFESKIWFSSVSGQFTLEKVIVSGEFARFGEKTGFGGWVLAEPLPGFKYILHRRYTEPGFSPLFGRPFADKMSSPGNESGWYHGLEFSVSKIIISFYRDGFVHPWPGYQDLYPSKGIEWFAGIEKRWTGNQNLKIQFRQAEQVKETSGISNQFKTTKYRAEWNSKPILSLLLKTRVDLNHSEKNKSGKAFTTQIKTNLSENGNLVFQCSWFDAMIYEDRIYVYESDLPGMMSFSPLYGEGVRFSLVTGNEVLPWMKLSVKFSFESSRRLDDGKMIKKENGFAGLQVDFKN